MRVRFGTIALTSLMTLGLEPAPNDSSFTLKIVFSFGLAAAANSAAAASSSALAPPAVEGATAPAAGKAISWMFRRVCLKFYLVTLRKSGWLGCPGGRTCWRGISFFYFTLRRVTRSAAWSSVRTEMSSTILCRAGSEGVEPVPELGAGEVLESVGRWAAGGGGDVGDGDDDGEVVAVASARARTNDSVLLVCAETLCGWMDGEIRVRAYVRLLPKKKVTKVNVTIDVAWPRAKQREVNDGRASLSLSLSRVFFVSRVLPFWKTQRSSLSRRRRLAALNGFGGAAALTLTHDWMDPRELLFFKSELRVGPLHCRFWLPELQHSMIAP